ncbi:MAG: pyridoxamine 5'-phosphate oxidase family protein [Hadesarchaea archaeon]|jgi:PPOX class probable F420-dependent enzyme|nr:pyridoxamine 5'-phosphate oxidase family protein [Hadesarchaea archaeon]TDA32251.1 MAG: pyridoxamine 5'-phosphate oxidase family protein [Hadesarchaea archaeon]
MRFSRREREFLEGNEVGRLATVGSDGLPHVVPVCYLFEGGVFYVATDYGTRKYRNVRENPRAALVVDTYRPHRAVMVQGEVEVLERGEEFRRIRQRFYERFDWARKDPWEEGEAPILKLRPLRKVSWGL